MSAVDFVEQEPGLFVVRYPTSDDLKPELQQPLIAAIVRAGAIRPTGVVFTLTASIRGIDMAVPTFWLEFTSRKGTGLKAIAIVTASAAVRVAGSGFALANRLRGYDLAVKTFAIETEAVAWVTGVLGAVGKAS